MLWRGTAKQGESQDYEKHRRGGTGGAAARPPKRKGQDPHGTRRFEWHGKPVQAAAQGKHAIQKRRGSKRQPTKEGRALPATAVPSKARAALAACPMARRGEPAAGARQGQRAAHAPTPLGAGSEDRPNSPRNRTGDEVTNEPARRERRAPAIRAAPRAPPKGGRRTSGAKRGASRRTSAGGRWGTR